MNILFKEFCSCFKIKLPIACRIKSPPPKPKCFYSQQQQQETRLAHNKLKLIELYFRTKFNLCLCRFRFEMTDVVCLTIVIENFKLQIINNRNIKDIHISTQLKLIVCPIRNCYIIIFNLLRKVFISFRGNLCMSKT